MHGCRLITSELERLTLMPRKQVDRSPVDVDALLRSINVRMDAMEPERLAHFRPTSKCIPLISGLLGFQGTRTWLVEAPYGTGKSLAAAYLLHLVENRASSREMLADVEPRLTEVEPKLGQYASRRRQNEEQGLALVLEGYEQDLPGAIQRATLEAMDRHKLGRQARPLRGRRCTTLNEALELLGIAQRKLAEAGYDRLSMVWDEFGRHLESLIAAGRASALSEVQTLAEYAARTSDVPMTLGLLLHQNLLQYADRASQSVRSEWAKIEGRFTRHQYIEDSSEIYRLLADAIAGRRPKTLEAPSKKSIQESARQAKALGYFSDWTLKALTPLLERAYPVEPTALALLPRLSARVAQSERTLFAFIHDVDLGAPLGPEALYDYFSPAMRTDTAVGGTYRRWLETESALSKADEDDASARALKTACLLGLGVSGERARASYEAVTFGVAGYGDLAEARAAIGRLVESKLLLFRRHNDQLAVWHGTDIDLRGRLEELKARERESFRLADFLSREFPPPVWKPVAYNDEFDIRRYLRGEYHHIAELVRKLNLQEHVDSVAAGEDGKILYLLPDNHDVLSDGMREIAAHLRHDRIIVAVPREPVALEDAALEVYCLRQLQHDPALIGEDPLAGSELEELTDDARLNLQRLVDRVVQPGPTGPRWFYQGEELDIASARQLRHELSRVMRRIYPCTPRIRNEMINRHQPSRPLVNARKKVMLGILERNGTPDLGISGHTPDASIYRTVLRRTGLYAENEGGWRFGQPEEIADEGLQSVWQRLRRFFTEPADQPKSPGQLFEELIEPPYGVRRGLLPVLFAAGYQAFPAAVAITKDREYLSDVLPSHIEDIVRNPDGYEVKVLALTEKRQRYLEGVYALFAETGEQYPGEGDLIRACYDAIEAWRQGLPPAAATSRTVPSYGRSLQRALGANKEPVKFLLEELPHTAGYDAATPDVLATLEEAKKAIEQVPVAYAQQAADVVVRVLNTGATDSAEAVLSAQHWASCFPDVLVRRLPERRLSGLVTRLATPYTSARRLIDSIAQLLLGKPVNQWDDASLAAFEREFEGAVRRIEDFALSSAVSVQDLGKQAERLAPLAQLRVRQWHQRYRELAGSAAAHEVLQTLESDHSDPRSDGAVEEPNHGDYARCNE